MASSRLKGRQRHEQIVRQWRVLLALDRSLHGLTFVQLRAQLASDLSVSERTVRRDIDALTLAGFPIDVTTRAPGEGALVKLERSNWIGGDVIFGAPAVTH